MKSDYRIEKWNKNSNPNVEELRQQMEDEGFSVFQWSDNPGRNYGRHKHGEDQSHWIISGKLELKIEDFGTVILEAGDRDFMPANTIHSARVVGDEAVIYLIGAKI
ncbi:MAG: cupin domain-containing protein [Acidobacteriota bacterium]|jgi:quercetin dioxygenase-like cupin family protein|nr:cupin domain-containing protein [Acidobacteriota bacterium]